jgi:hypothetical protein
VAVIFGGAIEKKAATFAGKSGEYSNSVVVPTGIEPVFPT